MGIFRRSPAPAQAAAASTAPQTQHNAMFASPSQISSSFPTSQEHRNLQPLTGSQPAYASIGGPRKGGNGNGKDSSKSNSNSTNNSFEYQQTSQATAPTAQRATGLTGTASGQNYNTSSAPSSPWTGYIEEGQLATVAVAERARREKDQRKTAKKVAKSGQEASASRLKQQQQQQHGEARATGFTASAPVSRSASPSIPMTMGASGSSSSNTSSSRTSSADIARFSINGMMSLVEQRMQAAELQEKGTAATLKAANQFPAGRSPYAAGHYDQSGNTKRAIYTMREEQEEEILSASSSTARSPVVVGTGQGTDGKRVEAPDQPRASTSSTASDATVLRDEVKELLLLARKASHEMASNAGNDTNASANASASTNASGRPSLSGSTKVGSFEQHLRSHSSASVHTNNTVQGSMLTSKSDKSLDLPKNVTAAGSIQQRQQHGQAQVAPAPAPAKKKFALFSSTAQSKKAPTIPVTSIAPVLHPPQRSTSAEQIRNNPPASANQTSLSGQLTPAANSAATGTQRVSRPHYGALTIPQMPGQEGAFGNAPFPRHGRKRSMSVPDPVPFSLIQAAGKSMQQSTRANGQYGQTYTGGMPVRRPRPDVYDESYFSSLKAPYYASLTTENQHKQRQNQLARLGIVEEATESNRAMKARSRIAMGRSPAPLPVLVSRNVSGHPGALRSGNAELTRPSPGSATSFASPSNLNENGGRHRVQDSDGSISSADGQYATYELAAHVKIDGTSSAPGGFMDDEALQANAAVPGVDLARSRSQRRRGQLMMASTLRATHASNEEECDTGQGQPNAHDGHSASLNGKGRAHGNKHAQNSPMLMRSNSDASFIDPYIPQNSKNKRGGQVAIPSPVPSVSSVDSLTAIGPPPSTPLPTLPPAPSKQDSLSPRKAQVASSSTSNSFASARKSVSPGRTPAPANILVPGAIASAKTRSGLSPAPSPAPTSPLPPPPAPARAPPPPPPPSSASAFSSASSFSSSSASGSGKDENGLPIMMNHASMQLRPHRTQQQGRSRLSPVDERFPTSPSVSPARSGHASPISPNGPYGSKGIPQAIPRELDMTVVPSPTPKPSGPTSASTPTSVAAAGAASALRRTRSVGKKQNRPDTVMTVASQYSVDGDFDESDENASRSSTGSASYAPGMTYSHSGNTTSTSISTSTGMSASMSKSSTAATTFSRTSSSSGWGHDSSTRPSLSMDGHTEEEDDMDDERLGDDHSQASHGSSEISNNIAGLGTYTFQNLPHSKRMHFGWQRSVKASRNLADARHFDNTSYAHGQGRIVDEDEVYEGILGSYADGAANPGDDVKGHGHAYAKPYHRDNEGYIGSSPESISPTKDDQIQGRELRTSQRQKSQYSVPVRHTRSFDQLSAFK